jgi:hypothetical protein
LEYNLEEECPMLLEQMQEAQQQQQQLVCWMKRAQVSNMKRLAHRRQTQCHREASSPATP